MESIIGKILEQNGSDKLLQIEALVDVVTNEVTNLVIYKMGQFLEPFFRLNSTSANKMPYSRRWRKKSNTVSVWNENWPLRNVCIMIC